MSWKKNWPLLAGAVAVLLLVYFGTATFSWLSAGQKVENSFLTAYPGVKLTEAFTPPENWKPGEEIAKRVGVVNIGETSMLVRISFDEGIRKIKRGISGYYDSYTFRDALSIGNGVSENTKKNHAGPVLKDPKHIAVPFLDSDAYIGNEYFELDHENMVLADASTQRLMAIPDNLVILHKKLTNGTTDSNTRTTYVYVAYFKYSESGSEKHQLVRLKTDQGNKKFGISAIPNTTPQKFLIDTGMIEYCYFPGMKDPVQKSWTADSSVPVPGRSISLVEPKIVLNYDGSVMDTPPSLPPEPASNWYFNKSDGYFYFINELKPDEATTTQLVSVTLASSAEPLDFNLAEYTLNVNLEAIQCDKAALKSTWFKNVSDEDPLFKLLEKCCTNE